MDYSIRVKLPSYTDRSYTVLVRHGLLDEIPALLLKRWKNCRAFIVTDSNVRRLYGSRLLNALSADNIDAWMLDFPAGEGSKNAQTFLALQTALLGHGIHRDSLIIALGGGVVGDVAGFVAATVMRGVPYVQVPTTLLAQVDSSVGGKVGIDHQYGKNLIGAFHQPAAVYIDPGVLRTLPVGEFRNGLAEIIKIGAALDARFFAEIERAVKIIGREHSRVLARIIAKAVSLKASVVRTDELDKGPRKVLNLGHTLGHAYEASTRYSIQHGKAVALGLVAESRIAVKMGILDRREYLRLVSVLTSARLPTRHLLGRRKTQFLQALGTDKKVEGNSTKFVLLERIGRARIGVDVPLAFILQSLGES